MMTKKPHRFASLALSVCLAGVCFGAPAADPFGDRDRSFDAGWRFLRGDAAGAEAPGFDDKTWRTLDLPHDWSIEDLPAQADSPKRVGPFDPDHSEGSAYTGHFVGGTGWYRKSFTLPAADAGKRVAVRFDGVYMNSDVWINGHNLGNHPYGYTSFEYDLTPYLKPAGKENVLAVRVRNEGQTSRWYSGSGIYRHAWLTVTNPIHVPTWGLTVTTPEVSPASALVKLATEVRNDSDSAAEVAVRAGILNSKGQLVQQAAAKPVNIPAHETRTVELPMTVRSPELWSPDSPELYRAGIEIATASKVLDRSWTTFGIRKIEVDAEHGFRLNGQPLKLKGGCMHHDNGPLGSVAIDRADERRVELMKANGFNAIRTSHNPPSPAFLDACDRLGMLVIDETFDCWHWSKKSQDYHLYFEDWCERDIASMVRRDRNHPSVVMWSIGNEIGEQFSDKTTAKRLREAVLSHDSTRPITQAVCSDWGNVMRHWDTLSDVAFQYLDVGGYNYQRDKYEPDHARNPKRVMMGTESYPQDFFENWAQVQKHSYVIGDFVWTAMDYFGESGVGHAIPSTQKDDFLMPWPWFNANCGDIDVCGFKKAQSYYRDVVWGRSPIEMAVHAPMPDGVSERVSPWGWPNELRSWTWPGQEGKPMKVTVYTSCDRVRLELNGKVVAEKPVSAGDRMKVQFDVPYEPGELRAVGVSKGRQSVATLRTVGAPAAIRLTPDRATIRADRNDLAYVKVEVVDAKGELVPSADIPIHFAVSGAGELAATGSAAPNVPASFRAPVRTTYQGRCLVILRPKGGAGQILLKAEANGLKPATLTVRTQ